LNLEQSKRLNNFSDLNERVQKQHALNYPDRVVELSTIRFTPSMDVEIPKVGAFVMTDWAKKQLGTLLGVQWDKWFDGNLVNAQQVQEEVNRRFSKTHAKAKLRTTHFSPGANGKNADGSLRAIVGPGYHPIDDARVFERLSCSFKNEIDQLKFLPHHGRSRWGNDHCNYYTVVGSGVNVGDLEYNHPEQAVQDAYKVAGGEGALGKEDWIYQGFTIRNSEVGYTALIVDEFFLRLVCNNGAIVQAGGGRMMYRQHRTINDAELDGQLRGVFAKAPERWGTTHKLMLALRATNVLEPLAKLDDLLEKEGSTKKFRELAAEMFKTEPLPTAWGMFNAITRAAKESDDLDKRYDAESLAGLFMSKYGARLAPIIH
jgi:hypothetical protein